MAVATTWDPGRMLHMARRDAGLSQDEVAIALTVTLGKKISRPLVSKWERNVSYPTIDQWRALMLLFEEHGVSDLRLLLSAWVMAANRAAA